VLPALVLRTRADVGIPTSLDTTAREILGNRRIIVLEAGDNSTAKMFTYFKVIFITLIIY